MTARRLFWIAAVGGTVIDLLSKWAIFRFCPEPVTLIPNVLHIVCAKNVGGVFGSLKHLPVSFRSLFFIVLTLAALVAIFILRRKYHPDSRFAATAFGLIIAGAIGNLWDRVTTLPQSYVRDFIDMELHLPRFQHWPTFNLADAFICIGVFMLLAHSFVVEGGAKRAESETS
ncbi:MAG: signal peptidase II [Planctomycetota bacterium]